MAAPIKQGLDYFPEWKPFLRTMDKINKYDKRVVYRALRNSCSGFIKRADVRMFVFNRDNMKCVQCGCQENLQVDHIISVRSYLDGKISLEKINQHDNLQTLYRSCNAAKLP